MSSDIKFSFFFQYINPTRYRAHIDNIITNNAIIIEKSKSSHTLTILLNNINSIKISDEISYKHISSRDSNEPFYGQYIKLKITYNDSSEDFDLHFDLFNENFEDNLKKFLNHFKIKHPNITISSESKIWDYDKNNYFDDIDLIYTSIIQKRLDDNLYVIEMLDKITTATGKARARGGNKINKKIKKHRQKSRKKKRTTRIKHTRRRYKNKHLKI